MAAGEYVSVSSQADTERADLDREREGLANDRAYEHDELAAICVQRGLDTSLARQVAAQLMQHDALGAHARDELGISDAQSARPIQAALASAGTFAIGAAMPPGCQRLYGGLTTRERGRGERRRPGGPRQIPPQD